ncbi:MAG: AtpZ/AtpI family protein [Sphingobacteriales bacterium]|nr:AtpZ/AtpI family protein [Sphingobacteriales bacterium]OJW36982.1 MAG: hypothetical protein BGO54_12870 [Sphingobacteriales bacterium 46-32]
MEKPKKKPYSSDPNGWMRYMGLGMQLLVAIGGAVFIGLKTDQWLHVSPLFASVLPLLVIGLIFYKLIRQTGNTGDNEK